MAGETREQFFAGYASRSGVTVEWLKEQGFHAEPCDCGDETCQGWQMVSKDAAPDPRMVM